MEDNTIEETAAPAKKQFEGFRKIDKTSKQFYRVPNEWINIMASINNLAELKVIEYIMRHTWGFGEYGKFKKITTDEFMHGRKLGDGITRMDEGTGLSNRSVIDGLRNAIEHGYVVCQTDKRGNKFYALKMQDPAHAVKNLHSEDCEESSQDLCNIFTDTVNNPHSHYEESSQTLEKETPERNSKKNTTERKNGKSQRNSTISTQEEASHSFAPSQDKSSLSPEGTKPAIVLTEKEQQIVKFGKKDIFKAADPIIDEKLKEDCGILAELIETQEQFDSLVAVVRSRFPKGAIHLKNLTNASVLNEWSQIQTQCTPDTQEPPEPDNDFVVADEELLEDIKKTVRFYGADDRFEECVESIMDFKRKAGLSNYKVCDMMANASIGVQREHGIDAFMEKLQGSLYW